MISVFDGSDVWKQNFVWSDEVDGIQMLEQKDVLDYDTDGNTTEVTRSFYHRNALGSVMEITDMNQAVVVSYRYDPYGKVTITRGGTPQSSDPLGSHWTFTGRFLDEEAGLLYYRARYYDPATGRFLQRDPLGYVRGPSLFSYVLNNPVHYRDPTGLDTEYVGGEGGVANADQVEALQTTIQFAVVFMLYIVLFESCDCGTITLTIKLSSGTIRTWFGGDDSEACYAPRPMEHWNTGPLGLGAAIVADNIATKIEDALEFNIGEGEVPFRGGPVSIDTNGLVFSDTVTMTWSIPCTQPTEDCSASDPDAPPLGQGGLSGWDSPGWPSIDRPASGCGDHEMHRTEWKVSWEVGVSWDLERYKHRCTTPSSR